MYSQAGASLLRRAGDPHLQRQGCALHRVEVSLAEVLLVVHILSEQAALVGQGGIGGRHQPHPTAAAQVGPHRSHAGPAALHHAIAANGEVACRGLGLADVPVHGQAHLADCTAAGHAASPCPALPAAIVMQFDGG